MSVTIQTAVVERQSPPVSTLPVLRSRLLSQLPGVIHGVTRRVVGLGAADGNVGFGSPRDRDDAWRMRQHWCASVGIDAERLVTVHQVHGTGVAVATRDAAGCGGTVGSAPLANADAIVTPDRGVALMTLHADCLPILLCDPAVPVVAAVHAGWRGTVAGVAERVMAALCDDFGAESDRTIAYLGPANRGCCYEVGDEVVAAWLEFDPGDKARALARVGDRWHFDVVVANRWSLVRRGVRPGNVETSEICTQCRADQWFSHRAQGPSTGRFGAVIALQER